MTSPAEPHPQDGVATPEVASPGASLASAGGALLCAATQTVASLRPAARPLHPVGVVRPGRLHRHGSAPATGVAWLDEPGEDEVVVRLSRAVGLPGKLPDIHGLALRVFGPGWSGDVLLASTGWGRLGRYVLVPSLRPDCRPMTSLLPYRTPTGPVLLGARGTGVPGGYDVFWAHGSRPWRRFAALQMSAQAGAEQDISFDPVQHQVPGLEQYPSVVQLREPSYHRARRTRAEPTSTD
jgi:hypothetical protein